jgi:signal transduction histidine kinase
LSQLLINLVDNALRYTSSGGSVNVDVSERAGWAELSVADTGIGIAAEHLPHLFERFYRADPARARADGGSGLGLAIAEWITQGHGGQISVASELGRGSTFTVRLPMVRVATRRNTNGVESAAAQIAG